MDRARRRKLVEDLAAKIRRSRKDVRAIILIGSVARGDDLPDSDVDLAVVASRGPWKPQKFTLDGALFNVYWKRWPSLLREMLEPGPGAERHGFLEGEALYDPERLLTKLRSLVGQLPEAWYRESAAAELEEAYEYVGKAKNAWRRRDRANLEYGARVAAYRLASVVAYVNRRHFSTENAVSTEWREFPDVPPGFARPFRRIVQGRPSDRALHEATLALWRVTRDWAAARGVRLHAVRSLAGVRIPKTR